MAKSDKKEQILLDVVGDYIKTAEPVSSGELLRKHAYKCSSATIRNIMVELDESGFLYQTHTSSGRIPTPKAYRFFVDKVALGGRKAPKQKAKNENGLPKEFKRKFRSAMRISADDAARYATQYIAEMTNTLAFAGLLEINHFYREGLSHLLEEPEFMNADSIRSLVEYADSLEDRLENLYNTIHDDIQIFIGAEENVRHISPFSLMTFSSELPGRERAVFGLVGPMRMNYSENLELLNSIRELFSDHA